MREEQLAFYLCISFPRNGTGFPQHQVGFLMALDGNSRLLALSQITGKVRARNKPYAQSWLPLTLPRSVCKESSQKER